MCRGPTWRFGQTSIGGEQVRAFVPADLPPSPLLVLDGRGWRRLIEAGEWLNRAP